MKFRKYQSPPHATLWQKTGYFIWNLLYLTGIYKDDDSLKFAKYSLPAEEATSCRRYKTALIRLEVFSIIIKQLKYFQRDDSNFALILNYDSDDGNEQQCT